MKLQTSGVLGTSYAIAKLAQKRGYIRLKAKLCFCILKFICYFCPSIWKAGAFRLTRRRHSLRRTRGKVNGQFPPKDANKRKDYTKKAYEVLQKVIKK